MGHYWSEISEPGESPYREVPVKPKALPPAFSLAALRPGDRVECRIGVGFDWHFCEVTGKPYIGTVHGRPNLWIVTLRRLGKTPAGHKWPEFVRTDKQFPSRIRASTADVLTCNVFADHLDEQGEHRAAEMLRKAFPLATREGSP